MVSRMRASPGRSGPRNQPFQVSVKATRGQRRAPPCGCPRGPAPATASSPAEGQQNVRAGRLRAQRDELEEQHRDKRRRHPEIRAQAIQHPAPAESTVCRVQRRSGAPRIRKSWLLARTSPTTGLSRFVKQCSGTHELAFARRQPGRARPTAVSAPTEGSTSGVTRIPTRAARAMAARRLVRAGGDRCGPAAHQVTPNSYQADVQVLVSSNATSDGNTSNFDSSRCRCQGPTFARVIDSPAVLKYIQTDLHLGLSDTYAQGQAERVDADRRLDHRAARPPTGRHPARRAWRTRAANGHSSRRQGDHRHVRRCSSTGPADQPSRPGSAQAAAEHLARPAARPAGRRRRSRSSATSWTTGSRTRRPSPRSPASRRWASSSTTRDAIEVPDRDAGGQPQHPRRELPAAAREPAVRQRRQAPARHRRHELDPGRGQDDGRDEPRVGARRGRLHASASSTPTCGARPWPSCSVWPAPSA